MGVYKKKNRWYIDYYLPDGKRKREVVKIPGVDPKHINRQDALKALSIRKAEIAEGRFDILKTDKRISFTKIVKKYLEWAEDNHKAWDRDVVASKPLLEFFGNKNIGSINNWLVEKYKSKRKRDGRKEATINKELGILKRMFNLAVDWKMTSSNPITNVKLLKVSKTNPRVLTEKEFNKLYNAASFHFKPILLCAYTTGMRRSEIANLKWENLGMEKKYIHVVETKTYESRSIPITKQLERTLNQLKKSASSEFIFTTPDGKPYTSKNSWKRAWNTTLKKSGIGKFTFHELRHTFISNLIVGEKEDYITVMELSGHKDITMLKRYSHTKEEAKKAAIKKLEKRVNV